MSTSASKKAKVTARTRGNMRQAKAHLTLEQLKKLLRGESIAINLNDDDVTLTLTSETVKDELDNLFATVDRSFRKIFGN